MFKGRVWAKLAYSCLFPQVLRRHALDTPLMVSVVLGEDGGYYPSTTLCQSSRSLDKVAASLELTRPEHAVTLANVLHYLSTLQKGNKCVGLTLPHMKGVLFSDLYGVVGMLQVAALRDAHARQGPSFSLIVYIHSCLPTTRVSSSLFILHAAFML
jgi:hypothetical protein